MYLVSMLLIQLLDKIQRSLAERLSDGVKVNKYQIGYVAEPQDGIVDIERILHVAVHQAWRVNECDQAEILLLGRGDLRADVIETVVDFSERLQLRIQMYCGIAEQ